MNQEEDYRDLSVGIISNYVGIIGTAEDTFEEYSNFVLSIEKYRSDTNMMILRTVFTDLINYLKYSNELSIRLEAGNTFLSLLRSQENIVIFLRKWNEYISTVKLTNSSFTIENKGGKIPKDKFEKLEKRLKFFVYIHMYQDQYATTETSHIFEVLRMLIPKRRFRLTKGYFFKKAALSSLVPSGRPSFFPFLRASSIPDKIRSRSVSLSKRANSASKVNIN